MDESHEQSPDSLNAPYLSCTSAFDEFHDVQFEICYWHIDWHKWVPTLLIPQAFYAGIFALEVLDGRGKTGGFSSASQLSITQCHVSPARGPLTIYKVCLTPEPIQNQLTETQGVRVVLKLTLLTWDPHRYCPKMRKVSGLLLILSGLLPLLSAQYLNTWITCGSVILYILISWISVHLSCVCVCVYVCVCLVIFHWMLDMLKITEALSGPIFFQRGRKMAKS